jgi:hypothetical protein
VLRGRNSDDQKTVGHDLDTVRTAGVYIIIWRGCQYFIPNNTVSVSEIQRGCLFFPGVAGGRGSLAGCRQFRVIQNLKRTMPKALLVLRKLFQLLVVVSGQR